ncbi:MAG TPA: Hsp20/alpha crystallin family protein [Bacteroidetes bacterium]|nr:Hsp20/alpha crystallin family protein [Bacteroidota bacterium]
MYNKREFHKHWNNFNAQKFRGFGEHPLNKIWKAHSGTSFNNPPANVKELDDKYELHLYVPGYKKSDFLITLIDQNLSISVDKKNEEKANWRRQEYIPGDFVRQFELNDKVEKSSIGAKYENGVLIISLPKGVGFETERQEIKIA